MRSSLLTVFLFLSISFVSMIRAQVSEDPDELYRLARIEAFEKENYADAIKLAEQALNIAPGYTEVKVFLGRVYHWNGNSQKGIDLLKSVLNDYPGQDLARNSLADIYIETGRYPDAVSILRDGLELSPTNTDFLFKAGYAEELSGDEKNAMKYYRQLEELQPAYPFLDGRIRNLNTRQYRWTATGEFTYTWVTAGFDPWKLGEIRLSRRTAAGSFGANIKYGERFSLQDEEIEIFAYPVINVKSYAYLAATISSSKFFPEYRLSAAYYRALPARTEVGLGYSYLAFSAQDVNVINVSLLKFTTRYRFNARLFYALGESNNDLTGLVYARRFIGSTKHYIELRGGYGSAAVEFNSVADINRLNSYELGIQGQWQFAEQFRFRADFGYFNEEFRQNTSRNRYQTILSIDYIF